MDPLNYQLYPPADNYGRLCSSSVPVSYSHASDDADDHSGGGGSIRSNDEHIKNYRVQIGYHSIDGVQPFEDTPYLPQRAHPAPAHHVRVPIPPESQPEYIQQIANSFANHFSNPAAAGGQRNHLSGAPERGLYPPGNDPSQLIRSGNSHTSRAADASHINSPLGSQSGQSVPETARSARLRHVGEHLRRKLHLPRGTPVNLAAIPDPEPGERPSPPLPTLTQLAIYGSHRQRLTLQEIYAAIENRFLYFRERTAWKGSIRHNLSLNKLFRSTPRPITEPGKGSYWELDVSDGEGYKRARKRRAKQPTSSEAPAAVDAGAKPDEDDKVSVPSSPGSPPSPSLDTEGAMRSSSVGPQRSRISPARTRASPYPRSDQQPAYTHGPGFALPTHYSGMQPQFGQSGFAGVASRSYPGSLSLQPGPSSLTAGARSVPHHHYPSSSRAPLISRSPLLDTHTHFGHNQEHQQIGHFPSASYIPPSGYSRQPSPYQASPYRQGPQIVFSPGNHGDVMNTGLQYQSHGYIGGELGGAPGRGPRST